MICTLTVDAQTGWQMTRWWLLNTLQPGCFHHVTFLLFPQNAPIPKQRLNSIHKSVWEQQKAFSDILPAPCVPLFLPFGINFGIISAAPQIPFLCLLPLNYLFALKLPPPNTRGEEGVAQEGKRPTFLESTASSTPPPPHPDNFDFRHPRELCSFWPHM